MPRTLLHLCETYRCTSSVATLVALSAICSAVMPACPILTAVLVDAERFTSADPTAASISAAISGTGRAVVRCRRVAAGFLC